MSTSFPFAEFIFVIGVAGAAGIGILGFGGGTDFWSMAPAIGAGGAIEFTGAND